MTRTASILSLTDVTVEIGGARLLDNVNCVIPGSGIIGLVGQNGSGKSTLMRLMARQLRQTRGRATLEGNDLRALSDRLFAQQVAYLPQSVPAAPGMTVRELVSLGRYPWHGMLGRFADDDARQVEDALRVTGTDRFANRIVDTLSGGERQRCWIAMLIAQNARLLLLDEPLSALDISHQHAAMALLAKVCAERAVSVVIILHDINLAALFCDWIIALKSGKVAAEGTPDAIMTAPTLQAIFDVPMLVAPHPGTGKPFGFVEETATKR